MSCQLQDALEIVLPGHGRFGHDDDLRGVGERGDHGTAYARRPVYDDQVAVLLFREAARLRPHGRDQFP